MSGLAAELATGAVVSSRPDTLVTEMMAKRGSTASSKVSEIIFGGELSTPLAVGEVLIR